MRKLLILFLAVLMTTALNNGEAGAAAPAGPEVKTPYAAQISPNVGLLKVREQVKLTGVGPDLHSFVIYLPASTSIQSGFEVGVNGFGLNSISRKELLPEDDPAGSPRAELVKQIKEARMEKARLEGLRQALDTRMQLWTAQASRNDEKGLPAQDVEKIDSALGIKVPEIYVALNQLPEDLEKVNQRLRFLENELSAIGGERPQLAEITVTVVGRAAPGQTVMAEYAYYSFNCGWHPSYSFDADPLKGAIVFKQQANIRQTTGKDWNGVELSLATKAPDFKLQPNPLYGWNLYREEPPRPAQRKEAASYDMLAAVAPADEPRFRQQANRPEPVSLELGTHREWQIGKVNISSKNPASIELERQDWKGDFYYTLRPSREESAYLTAKVKLDKSIELAPGSAIFVVDKRLAGFLNSFSAGGKEIELFFGKDDMISVEMQDLVSMKGEERFIRKTNTYNWNWKFKVENRRNRPVKVRVEDPMPQARDSSIKLKVESTPKAEEDYQFYYWEATVPAAGEFVIEHKVEAKASGSEPLVPGRR